MVTALPHLLLPLLLPHIQITSSILMNYLFQNTDFTRKSVFLSVLPAILQLTVEAGARHPFQRPDCFELYKVRAYIVSLLKPHIYSMCIAEVITKQLF